MNYKLPTLLFSPCLPLSGLIILASLSYCKPAAKAASSQSLARTGNANTKKSANIYEGKTLKIGFYGSLTGSTAAFGISSKNGIQMAFDEINAKGGPLGKRLELVIEDNGSRTEQVPDCVFKLINQSHVLAILGESSSARSLAAAPIAQHAKVPMVSPGATNPAVTKAGDYIFRSCFIDPFQGTVMATFARGTLKARKAAIFTDVANEYPKSLTKSFIEKWKQLGGQIVATESYSEDDEDFESQLKKIKVAAPDVIYVPGYYTEVGKIAVQARHLGLKQPLLGGDGWDSPRLFAIGGKAIQGGYFSNHFSSQSKDPRVVRFVRDYRKKFGTMPDAVGAVAYDAAYFLSDAIKRAGALDRAKLRNALASTQNFPCVTGPISIDKNRNAVKPAVVLKVGSKEATYVITVKP
jgi:branched-chain amino acid transport system substrate-binding protein